MFKNHISKLIITWVHVKYVDFLGIDARPYTFSYNELRTATDDFSPSNKLGEGGFGPVYKVSYCFQESS